MKMRSLFLRIAAFALFLGFSFGFGLAQESEKGRRLELRVNLLSLPLGNFNLGLRVNTAHRLKPDFYVAVQAPLLSNNGTMGQYAFADLLGYGVTAYGGLTLVKGDGTDGGLQWSFQLGAKAFRTGRYEWRAGGGDHATCGESALERLTIGPRVLIRKAIRLSDAFALEPFVGLGFRIGVQKEMGFKYGDAEEGCTSYGFVPSTDWGMARGVFVPTVHGGVSIVVH